MEDDGDQREGGAPGRAKHARDDIEGVAVKVVERAAPLAALGLTAAAVDAAASAVGAATVAASAVAVPVIGTAIVSLIPVVIEAIRRVRADPSPSAARAHALARQAWAQEVGRHGREIAK